MRIRSIRPELYEHRSYVRMSRDARRVLLEVIGLADDDGRLLGSARHLWKQRYAEDDDVSREHVEGWLAELEAHGWLTRYEAGGDTYGVVLGWADEASPACQRISHPRASRLPGPPSRPHSGRVPEAVAKSSGTIPDVRRTDLDMDGEEEKDLGRPGASPALPLVLDVVEAKTPTATERERANVLRVHAHWRTYHPKAGSGLDSTSLSYRHTAKRLREGSSVETLCAAIDGCHRDPWRVEHKATGLDQIMKDSSLVARFAEAGQANAPDEHPLIRQAREAKAKEAQR